MQRDRGPTIIPPPSPLETPPPESPPYSPSGSPENAHSLVNLYNSFQMKRDRSSITVPPPQPSPLQSHRPFSSFGPLQLPSILGPCPGGEKSSNRNNYWDIWTYFPPAQKMNNSLCPSDLGDFPPWKITVNVAGGQTRSFNIPCPENNVIGLPLGLDVPEVIAGHYEGLLHVVHGMKDVITDIAGELARYQQDAYRYYCELEELKFRMGGNRVVSQDSMAPVTPVKKRKMIPGKSVPWEEKEVEIYIPEPLPPSVSNKETLLYCSEVQTETVEIVESIEFYEPVGQSVKDTVTSSSTMYQTEGFEFLENLEIPEEYENLYKNISNKFGHMATRNVIKRDDDILLTLVVSLLKNITAIETMPVAELSGLFLDRWEADIKLAETLQFNIKWLRHKFNEVKKCWRLDKDIETHEQELDSEQVKYVGLWARRKELDQELAEVKSQIRNAEAKISCEREAIREKLAQIYDQIQPAQKLQGTVLS